MSGQQTGLQPVARGRRAWSVEADAEISAVLRLLEAQPWLLPGRDDAAIGAVRRNLDAVREAFGRLGWVLVVERDLVRLRKSPPVRRAAWAASAPPTAVCMWFFLLVAAAESTPPRVALGGLVAAARSAAAEAGLEVTGTIPERRAIAAALRLLDARGVIEQVDGNVETYVQNDRAEVLLAVHHTRLVHVIANFADIDPSADPAGWLEQVEREPDAARRMRRRLVDDAVVHTVDLDDAEADWLSRRVRGDDGAPLAAAFGLHLERRTEGAAFVVPAEAFRYPRDLGPMPFPAPGTVGHASLLLCDAAAREGAAEPERPGWRSLTEPEVLDRLGMWARQVGAGRGGWSADDVEDPASLARKVLDLLTGLDLVRPYDVAGRAPVWWFSPAIGRWADPGGAGLRATVPTDGPRVVPTEPTDDLMSTIELEF